MATSSGDVASHYHVFLSFRGRDTRHSFTDHLYRELKRIGILAFRDNDEMEKGEELKPEFKKAIEESKGSIVVLSENYATSTWCLDELVFILERKSKGDHFVLPIFYGVEPTDIRHQNGTFSINVDPLSPKWTADNVNKWKEALVKVADLGGEEVIGPETSFLNKFVVDVYNKLNLKEVSLPLSIVGLARHEKEINSWLDQCNLQVLVIYGMNGSGKTTLAQHIYDLNWKKFESVSFLKIHDDLAELQEQLLKDISCGKNRTVPDVSRGMPMIEMALKENKVLIVLDDVTDSKQLRALLGTGHINSESKIIVTTLEYIDAWFDSSSWKCQKYPMKLLSEDESAELFCLHAFRSTKPKEEFKEIVQRAIQYCGGNPMALEQLGSSLPMSDAEVWASQLNSWEKDINFRLHEMLIRSYNSLPSDDLRDLFLHIACFFIGVDIDYVGEILEPDCSAISGIKILIQKGLLSVSPNRKLSMHRLFQEMGKHIVRQESTKFPAERSRVWLSSDSYKILTRGIGSKKIEGLALDMQKLLLEKGHAFKSSALKTDALKMMEILKLLQLKFVELNGDYENFPEGLRWLCWLGFHLTTVPSNLYMENLVAIDMSYSNLEVFEPPTVIDTLKTLNLKDSHKLTEIRSVIRIQKLENLILWNCYSLVHVRENLGDLSNLKLLNMTGCKNLCCWTHTNQPTFSFPRLLRQLFLKDCHLERIDSFLSSSIEQPFLQYMNLGNSRFESFPFYDHLKNLRVLDLSFCSRLKCLLGLPSTLAELYIYYCVLLERITFQNHRFTLQEFGYEGCISLYEVEGFIKLVPIAKLDEFDLEHMKWLKEYENHEVHLVGDEKLTVGRSRNIQMLYEFDIMSISLPNIKDRSMLPKYTSESSSLSFDVPSCPKNKRLKGIDVTFKYSMFGDDWAWFCKINTTNGVVDRMYNPKVFGKPEIGEVCIWLSYWPIGNKLDIGDTVNVSIVVLSGLEVHECGVSLVYSDQETMEYNMGREGDFSGFKLSTGAYYLCRRDFFELMEVGRLTPDWFRILVGDTIDYTEIRGWRNTGRPKQVNPSFIELKTIRCIIHGPQLEDIYNVAEMSKLSIGDKTVSFTSSLLEGGIKSGSKSEITDETKEETYVKQYESGDKTSDPYSHGRFVSEVELGKFLGSIDIIPDAYRAISETDLTYELHTTRSGLSVLAFKCSPDYTNRFLNGEFDLVSSENRQVVDFIPTKVNSSFKINEAAVELFQNLSDDLKEQENKHINTPLIITGSGLGGYLAILSTLRLHHAIDVEESKGVKNTKRPICITFGSPLIGDAALQRAIAERPRWKSSLLNVVAKMDPIAGFLSSNTQYKPFGTFLFCTESGGYTAFEDQDLISLVLNAMKLSNLDYLQMYDYTSVLSSLKRKILYRVASKLAELNMKNVFRAGITLQLREVGVLDDMSDQIEKMEKQIKFRKSKKDAYGPTKKLNEMKISLTYMEWYMKTTQKKGGYYDSYKNPNTREEIESQQHILMHKRILNRYWEETVNESDRMPQKEGAHLRRRWLYGGTNYRRIVEPLDIAEHYKKGNNINYIENRPDHYKLLEKWLDENESKTNEVKRNKAASLTEDSCFWARVEEAIRDLANGGSINAEKDFEDYVMRAIKNYSVSPDIFLPGSSFMGWWNQYKVHKGAAYNSELAQYMNNKSYTSYQ